MNRLTEFLNEINYKPGKQLKAMLSLFSDPPQPKAKPRVWTDLMAQTASSYQPGEVVMLSPDVELSEWIRDQQVKNAWL